MKNVTSISTFLVLVIVFILFAVSNNIAQVKGGRWMFENNGNDEAAWDLADNNGVLSGSAMYTNTGIIVQGNYYLSIEDSANYGVFTIADQEELDFLDENFAASLWVFPVKGYDNPQHLLMKGDRSGSIKKNNYALRINKEVLEFIVHSESGSNKVAKSSFKIVENKWNFVAVYYDYGNSKLYIWNNNESDPIDTLDFNAPLFPNDDKLYIGTSGENGFKRFWGRIDDIRIGNKVADIIDFTTNINQTDNKYLVPNFILSQNYPNPFNPETIIKFSLKEKDFTKLTIYDLLGIQIKELVNSELSAGEYEFRFNARNLSSGVYFYNLQHGKRSELKKMLLIK